MPRSSLLAPKALWPARRIAEVLVTAGLARSVLECLRRTRPLPRASLVPANERPSPAAKLESMACDTPVIAPPEDLIVDDVVTTGASLLAAASILAHTMPRTRVRSLAIARTMSGEEVDPIRQPCVGRIRLEGNRSIRRP